MATFLERLRGDPARVRLERLERLQGLTEELSAAQTREEVLRVIFERGLALVDASAVMLYVERAPGELELVHGLGVSDEFVQRQRRVLSEDPLPIAEAYRTGTPVWLASREEIGARFPRLEPGADRVRALAWAAIPLASGAVRGALGLQFPERRAFDEEERNFVLAVARQCSLAVERARLFDASSRLAERLRQLLSTTSALSSATTVRDVAAAAFRALGALGACAAEIHGIEEGGERVALLARHGRAAAVRGVAVAVVALLASGRSLGALVAIFAEPRRLESDDRTFVRLVAQPCAQALERARLFEEAARSRVEAEWDSALVAGMCGAAPVGLALLDREMRFVKVNENFARVDGVALAAHVGRTPLEILPQAPADEIVSAFRSALDSGQALEQPMEGAAPSEPGVRRRFATSWFPVRVRGEIAGVGVLLRELR